MSATDAGSGVAETRCALDPASMPTSFDDLAAGCPFLGTGAPISGDGIHVLYAASRDSAGLLDPPVGRTIRVDGTDPELSCRQAAFVLGGTGSVVADVSDAGSGPASATASAGADTSSVGARSVSLTAWDLAGNSAIATCPYVVGYDVVGPIGLKSAYRAGSVVPVRIGLAAASGARISDASAATVAGACGVRAAVRGGAWACATYDGRTDEFVVALRSSRAQALGAATLVVEVREGEVVVNTLEATITFR